MADLRPLGAVLVLGLLAGCTTSVVPAARAAQARAGASFAGQHAPRRPQSGSAVTDPFATSAGGGTLLIRRIPGSSSGFAARSALVWLPPVLRRRAGVRLPVLELLHGVPGGPRDWFTRGGAGATLDAFAARHGGQAPIVVAPDINGARHLDTECVRTPGGADVERYLTVDVPRWVDAHFPVARNRRWSVAGLSEGGTCALMLALRHPGAYGLFGDLSGLARPSLARWDDPVDTTRILFRGSSAQFDQHDPLWLMRQHRYPTLAGWLGYGAGDVFSRQAATQVLAAGRTAGVPMHEDISAGRHSWTVWSQGFRRMLPWLWRRWS